jgi:hypothetical protein
LGAAGAEVEESRHIVTHCKSICSASVTSLKELGIKTGGSDSEDRLIESQKGYGQLP